MRSIRRLMAIAGAGLLLLTSVASGAAQSAAPSPAPATGHLREAVSFLPTDATDVAFTDWSRIRASLGAEDVTGDSPIDDKMAVLMATNGQEAAASLFGARYLRHHHDTWGWDTLDVDWEATYWDDGPPVTVVRLRDGTDVNAIAAHYDEYGFTTEETPWGTIRSHEQDLRADWARSGEVAVTNTAFLDDGRTLVFSSSLDALRHALGRAVRTPLPGQAQVVDALDGASAAWLELVPDCAAFTPPPVDPLDPDASVRPLATGEPLHPWTALGIGYARPDWDPVGRIVMGFRDPADTEADALARTTTARDGVSLRTHRPYAEAVFRVEESHVDATTLTLDVSPVEDRTPRLFQMVVARDMTFAGC